MDKLKEEFYTYLCPICHTSFVFHSSIENCIFCGGTKLTTIDNHLNKKFSFLPFSISLEEAFSIYKKRIRYNVLVPFSFRGKKMLHKIQKAYLPCNLLDIVVDGNIIFYGAERIKNVPSLPKQLFECMYSTHFDYMNMLFSNYSRIDNVSLSSINDYDFTKLSTFDSSIMNDACLIVSDDEKTDLLEKVRDNVMKQCVHIVRGNVEHTLKKLADNQMNISVSSNQFVLVPVYFINFRYKGHEFLFLVNGQTKKSMIDVPINMWNLVLFSIVCFLLLVFIGIIIALFI